MLAVIARPWNRSAVVDWGVPPAPFGEGGFGPDLTYRTYGQETRVLLADDTFIGDPADTGAASSVDVELGTPPAPFGEGGFGPPLSYEFHIPASSLPSSENLASAYFPPRLSQSFNFQSRLFEGDEPAGRSRPGLGEMIAVNSEGGLDGVLGYGWDGRSIEIFEGDRAEPFYPNFTRRFVGTSEGLEWGLETVRIRLRDPQLRLDQKIQQAVYAGSGGVEGGADLAGQLKPAAFGYCENIAPKLLDSALLTYDCHDGELKSIVAVRDKGVALTFDANYATYATLAAASVPAGRYATALAVGKIRLGSAPAGQITVDLEGDSPSGDYVSDTGGIIRRIATRWLAAADRFLDPDEIHSAAFASLYAQQPAEVGYFVGAGETAAQVFDLLMAAIGGAWSVTLLGQLSVRRLAAPTGTATTTLAARQIGREIARRGTVPSWRRRLGYRRMWTVQSKDELAGAVTEANRALYSEQYRYAVATSDAAREAHKRARDVVLPGFFRNQVDAADEAARQQELFGTLRHVYAAPVEGRNAFASDLGERVDVADWTRFGWSNPAPFVLVGIQADIARGTLVFELWA